ncbi:MAG TPA: AAA family ATPase, partial [Gemmatimonadaceae bacterium]|nr:AAA family ATPase [Gemmatimonadaceae bacterium]
MIHLRSVGLAPDGRGQDAAFPFSVPAIRSLESISLEAPVTFFVGENGSGKSTLLEGIALATRLPAVGAERVDDDETLAAQRRLGAALRLTWNRRTHRGFFLRAEDFFGFAKSLARLRAELLGRLEEIDATYTDRSPMARALARGPAAASLSEMEERYGTNLDENS